MAFFENRSGAYILYVSIGSAEKRYLQTTVGRILAQELRFAHFGDDSGAWLAVFGQAEQ